MLDQTSSKSRGDTLIEVLFAIAIFSLVAIGGLAIMNQGTSTAQRALEITLVRNEIDAQAEALRFMNASYIAAYQTGGVYDSETPAGQWSAMLVSKKVTDNFEVGAFGVDNDTNRCPDFPPEAFIINTNSASFIELANIQKQPAQTFSQVRYNADGSINQVDGIWIEGIRSSVSEDTYEMNAGYIDFHIRACWDSPGQPIPVTIGTIVRLYEPR